MTMRTISFSLRLRPTLFLSLAAASLSAGQLRGQSAQPDSGSIAFVIQAPVLRVDQERSSFGRKVEMLDTIAAADVEVTAGDLAFGKSDATGFVAVRRLAAGRVELTFRPKVGQAQCRWDVRPGVVDTIRVQIAGPGGARFKGPVCSRR